MTPPTQKLRILGPGDVGIAVVAAREAAQQAGLDQLKSATLATAVSELATNIVKYAEHGWVTLDVIRRRERIGVEVVVEDQGPGIEDLTRAMQDHVSSGGTLGLGLPGTQRMVDLFDIRSIPNQGTYVRIIVWS